MDKTPSEVTDRIRTAIKKKLIELHLYVDNELPDYIMLLIANKRSKHHMEKDLSLFLGNHTENFTNWLWDLVNNLKGGFVVKNATIVDELKRDTIAEAKETKIDEDDVLNYDPAEEGETLCLEETVPTNVQTTNVSIPPVSEDAKLSITSTLTVTSTALSVANTTKATEPTCEYAKSIVASEIPKLTCSRPTSNVKSAKVYPVQQLKLTLSNDSVVKECKSNVKTYDPSRPDFSGSVNSIVCVTQRKYNGPAALQANKLLQKAVSEATKSVLNGQNVEEFYKPTPIKDLSLNKPEEDKAISLNKKIVVEKDEEINEQQKIMVYKSLVVNDSSQSSHISLRSQNELYETVHDVSDSNIESSDEGKDVITPHFIVTLDGVKLPSLKRKHSVEEPMDIDNEDSSEDYGDFEASKKLRLNERCKFWPTCKNSNNCLYHHPTIPCKCFPDCKFGDKCLYVHPNCKFDSLCSRKDCPYTHCSKRRFKSEPSIPIKTLKTYNSKIICKYYPKCTATSCRFIHPKLCRFGTKCRDATCRFSHFQVPHRNQLKWKAATIA